MTYEQNDMPLYLLVDIDDLLVYSSDKLQEILDKRTNFKTDTLRMLEQLNRNCRYLLDEVQKECQLAKDGGFIPNLDRFPFLKNQCYTDLNDYYTRPIKICRYYLESAKLLLNQFLEERDTFLEIDNRESGDIITFDYKKEMNTSLFYTELILHNKKAFHEINLFCLEEAKRLIDEAKANNSLNVLTVPKYGALVSMDTNDIIKKSGLGNKTDKEYRQYILYDKPIDNITNCINLENRMYDIITNARVFSQPSETIVDYQNIHSLANVNWDAVALVKELIHSGMFKGVYFSTHHNGSREEAAKIPLTQYILPEADGFIGQRFHSTEHDAKRRDRSSKIDYAVEYLGVSPSQIVLLDDSKANCKDCQDKGGTPILYKPETDSERINNCIEETGLNRILEFNIMIVCNIIANINAKQKKIIK